MHHPVQSLAVTTASAAPNTRRRDAGWNSLPYVAAALLVLLAWIGYRKAFPVPVFPMDDAYIVIHNAQVLLSGNDPNYAGASPLSGATSVVHLALVTELMRFLSPLSALSASLWGAALLYALGLVRLARVNGAGRTISFLVAVLGLAAGEAPHQLVNGLETGLMLAAVTWILTLLPCPAFSSPSASNTQAPSRLLPVLCGTLPFIRPDLLPLALIFLGLQTAWHWRLRRNLADFLRRAGIDLAVACVFALPWAVWSDAENGSVFPLTLSAKRFFFAQAGWPAAIKARLVLKGLYRFAADLGLMTIFAVFLAATWTGRAGILFGALLLAAYFMQLPGTLITYEGRYLFPFLPFILLGAVYALRQAKPLLRTAAVVVFALSLGQSFLHAPDFWNRNRLNCSYTTHDLAGVAGWCNRNLPANSTLLIHDAGYISYGTRFPLIDMVGLKTLSSIPHHEKWTYPTSGRDRFQAISEIGEQGHTNYLLVLDRWDRSYFVTEGLRAAGWKLRLVNADYAFKVYALTPPSSPVQNAGRLRPFHPPLISGEGVGN